MIVARFYIILAAGAVSAEASLTYFFSAAT